MRMERKPKGNLMPILRDVLPAATSRLVAPDITQATVVPPGKHEPDGGGYRMSLRRIESRQ